MGIRRSASLFAATALAAALITPLTGVPAGAASDAAAFRMKAHRIGTAHISAGTSNPEARPAQGDEAVSGAKAVANRSPHANPKSLRGTPLASGVTGSDLSVQSGSQSLTFRAINHIEQRLTNGGNQWSTAPPDQGLCVGNGQVVEAVNTAIRVYDTAGGPLTDVVGLNPFFGYPPEIVRSTGIADPHQVGDPSCVYDAATNRFFLTTYEYTGDSAGNFTGPTFLDIAVSPAGTGVGSWALYQLDTTNDGLNGTPNHGNCPCFPDYPHLGTDATGFYVTTNEYQVFGDTFNGANIYAFAKSALIAGGDSIPVSQWNTARQDNGQGGFTLAPALASGTNFATAAGGTMYFLSSNAAEEATGVPGGTSSTHILVWSLTNTSSLASATPTLALHHAALTVAKYAPPPPSNQKVGSVPLADCLNLTACSKAVLGTPDKYKEYEYANDSGDSRMYQSAYANGNLWGALGTAIDIGGATKAGVAYYVVHPTSTATSVSGTLVRQGTFGVAGNNVSYPAVGVTSAGEAVMAMTLVGTDYYPSAAYVTFDAASGPSAVKLISAGLGPDDEFVGYRGFQYNRPRWGDYGAASVVGGNVWIASESIEQTCTLSQYIAAPLGRCGGTRTALDNWATRISVVTP